MKSTEDEFEVRKGPGYQWFMSSGGDYSRYDVSGFTIDNLDTKKIEDAENGPFSGTPKTGLSQFCSF